ncbi:MAG: hypothetical protein ABI539_07535 [Acidobacteriota bacterium]
MISRIGETGTFARRCVKDPIECDFSKSYHEIAFQSRRFYPPNMNELDELWAQMLAESAAAARSSGLSAVADYLELKAFNDRLRQTGVKWLFDTLIEAVYLCDFHPTPIVERENPHSFAHKGATMMGSLLRIRHGLRCLTAEAGWTRTPADGFMRGGALAAARISHRGLTKANIELLLINDGAAPSWKFAEPDRLNAVFLVKNAVEQVEILIDRAG